MNIEINFNTPDFQFFLADAWEQFLSFLDQASWQNLILIPKIISISFSLGFLVIIIFLLIRLRGRIKKSWHVFKSSVGAPDLPKKRLVKKWEDILKSIEAGDENAYKMAVIEADKMFDDILKKIGYSGKDMGERMKNIKPAQMPNLNDLWRAHKTRNSIVHDPNFKITRAQAAEAVKMFQKALKDLQVI